MSRPANNQDLVLGDLIAAAFDYAEIVTDDARAASELAARTTARWLARADRLDLAQAMERPEPSRRRRATRVASSRARAA